MLSTTKCTQNLTLMMMMMTGNKGCGCIQVMCAKQMFNRNKLTCVTCLPAELEFKGTMLIWCLFVRHVFTLYWNLQSLMQITVIKEIMIKNVLGFRNSTEASSHGFVVFCFFFYSTPAAITVSAVYCHTLTWLRKESLINCGHHCSVFLLYDFQ